MKRLIFPLILALFLLSGCAKPVEAAPKTRYQATFLSLFDTVTTIIGYAGSEEEFRDDAQKLHDELLVYHQLFDIYEDYDGIQNIKTINDNAGIGPVKVDRAIIDLLLDCREYAQVTNGKVNVAMGSVLKLWHEARTDGMDDPLNAETPDPDMLRAAAEHVNFDTVLIDEEASSVFITDPDQRLDVGAIAKGWATARVCETAPEGFLVSVGGNVCATGPKPEKKTPWVVGIQDPDGAADDYLHTVAVEKGCVVTSGDYQRYYIVDETKYHHIIDPETLFPGTYWKAVSVICEDSGVADMLSTALFLLPQEAGQELLTEYNACAMWVDVDGAVYYSDGFKEKIRT